MKEIFDSLKRTGKNGLVLLDTCFLIDEFHHHREKELAEAAKIRQVAITSFNAEELVHVLHHKVKDTSVKDRVRKFFKEQEDIKILEIPVHPGDQEAEMKYVREIDPYLAQDVPDPSDAVLVAAAIRTRSVVVTKDKHHLFTALLENYLTRWGLKVVKSLKEL
ncbi:PIN domain-containing protein [Candidatus Woesearchaeota archaeon]|nr:PIN domain-containing protein [Candidatus Woesearchaeota archaeon]